MKKSMLFVFSAFILLSKGQISDTSASKINTKRHELGVNLLPPLLFFSGARGIQSQYFNLTYRYLSSKKNAFRITAGANVYNNGGYPPFRSEITVKSNDLTVFKNTDERTPVNLMTGIGYERIMGKRKLKHVIGFDLTYNYMARHSVINYYAFKDSLVNGNTQHQFIPVDTGRTELKTYYHKFGIAPFYSLRYELNPKWLITASTRINLQYCRVSYPGYPRLSSFDFNTSGLLSELSLFYRF